ncbi:MAG TPA: DUF5305 family protein [Bacilli bacterium]|nr:DUF5305 family protein [Bacilli bacterium]
MRLKKNSKLIIIFSLMLVVFAVVTFYYFYSTANTDPDTITFEEQSKNEYSVCLKDNNYFDEKCLNSERNYVAEIIDYVDINFNYLVKYSKAVKNSYTYSVVANLIATSKDEESKILYNKEEILLPAKTYQSEAANIDMTQNVKIDYNKYNNIINSFRKDYVISLNSKLIVTFIIKYNGEISKTYSDKSLNRTIKVEIPLGEQTVSISNDNNYNNTEVLH